VCVNGARTVKYLEGAMCSSIVQKLASYANA
jgi:hypothetical protein